MTGLSSSLLSELSPLKSMLADFEGLPRDVATVEGDANALVSIGVMTESLSSLSAMRLGAMSSFFRAKK